MSVHQVKTWWIIKDPSFHVDSEDSDRTELMPRPGFPQALEIKENLENQGK